MIKDVYDHLVGQLDIMSEELNSVEDIAKRAELRGQYINLFISLDAATTVTDVPVFENKPESLDDSNAKVIDESVLEEDIEEEIQDATPPEVTAETEAVLGDPLADAEEVFVVKNEEGEDVDITEAMGLLKDSDLSQEEKESIALYITECACLLQYEEFKHMKHGNDRACIAAALASLGLEELTNYVVELTNVPKDTDIISFIDDENAETIFNFIYGE